jgi:hypothetical protein
LNESYNKQKKFSEALDLDGVSKLNTSKTEKDPLKQLRKR